MRLNSLTILLLIGMLTSVAHAQTKPPTATETAADEVCTQLSRIDITTKTSDELQQLMQDMIVKIFANHFHELMDEMGFDNIDGENGRKIGEEIGRKLLLRCPAFIAVSVKLSKNQPDNDNLGNTQGVISNIISPDFTEIILKDADGRENTFYWLRYFKGSEQFEHLASYQIGKKVKITWGEIECYLPKAQGYYKIKEIKSIDFIN